MSRLGYHLVTRLDNGGVIARDIRERRMVARVVLDQGKEAGLYCFAMPDTHLHMGAENASLSPGELCRRVGIALKGKLKLKVGFHQYPPTAIRDQGHLCHVVRYILTQHRRHQVVGDPFREATNLPDLLGLRGIEGAYTLANLHRLYPRLSRNQLLEWLEATGLGTLESAEERRALDAAMDTTSPEVLTQALVEATCRATCLDVLAGSRPAVVAARRAALEVGQGHLAAGPLARMLGIAPTSLRWLRRRPADPDLARAIRMQLCLGTILGRRV